MRIALSQLNSTDDLEANFQQIADLIMEASRKPDSEKPRIIFFPENSLYFRINTAEPMPRLPIDCDQVKRLEELSRKNQIYLHLTSSFFQEGHNWNASILIDPNHATRIVYKKIHLFDIQLEGDKAIRESDVFTHGMEVTLFEVEGLKFGSSICYDIRFAELYHQHALAEVDAIVVPAAFLMRTGLAHWEVLLRARAIESQAYIIAPAQAGTHQSQRTGQVRETFGNSMFVDPWGAVISRQDAGVGLIYAEIDQQKCLDVRKQIPMASHRRLK